MRRTPSGDDAFGDLGESDPWSPNEFDAPTEEYSRMMGTSPGGYVAGGYPRPGGFATHPPADGSAEMRVVVGILCVLGGLMSGAGALIVALWPR